MGFAICIATSDAGEVKKGQDWLYDLATGRVCWIREPSEANLIIGSTGLKRVKLSGAVILNLLTKNGRYTRTSGATGSSGASPAEVAGAVVDELHRRTAS